MIITFLAAEKIFDCTPINLGTGRRYKIIEVVEKIFEILNWKPMRLEFDSSKPVGAISRALDNSRAREMIGWHPRFTLEEGLRRTIEWYLSTHKIQGIVRTDMLLEHR